MRTDGKPLAVVLAPNPSPLTGPGTNTFLLGRDRVAVIDPGPDLPAHRAAILAAVGPGRITHIFVTHAHLDHSGGGRALARETGAPILAFGDAKAGRRSGIEGLAGGEGVDADFAPDVTLADGARIEGEDWALTAHHTPGHFGNHLSFQWDDLVLTGDVVMGWSSTLISPPDGDLADYFRTLERLAALGARRFLPAHGAPVDDPAARLAELAAHRRSRSAQIMAALREGPADAAALTARLYRDVDPILHPAAARNVLAHLVALADLGALTPDGPITPATRFHLP